MQSDNGSEFVNVIVHKMLDEFNIKIVNGAPRHSQSQGSVERGNKDIEDLLYTWMSTNKTRWADALPSIRFMKNIRYHRTAGQFSVKLLFKNFPVVILCIGIILVFQNIIHGGW